MRIVLFILASFFSFKAANAQSPVIDTIKILTNRLNLDVQELSTDLYVIGSEMINNNTAASLDELIQMTPGVQMLSRGRYGTQADVSIRGTNFNQVLVLIDGVRANDPLTGHFNMHIPVSSLDVERIEVIKNAASSIYGSEAIGGVINIITKKSNKNQLGAELLYGSNSTLDLGLNTNINLNKWNIGVSGRYLDSDGHTPEGDSSNYDFNNILGSIDVSYTGNNFAISARSSFDERDFNARYFYTVSTFDLSRETVTRQWNQVNGDWYVGDNHHFNIDLGYQVTQDSFLFNPLFVGNFHTTKHLDVHAFDQWEIDDTKDLSFGINYLSQSIESNDRGDHNRKRLGAFVNYNQQFGAFGLNLGANLTDDEIFGVAFSPSLGLRYDFSENIFASARYSQSIRSADFTENYVSTNLPSLSGGRNLGNPELEEETLTHYDVNLGYQKDNIKIQLSLFRRVGTNLIDFASTLGADITTADNISDTLSYFYAQNVSELNTNGLELSMQTNKQFGKLGYTGVFSITLLDFENPTGAISRYVASGATTYLQYYGGFNIGRWTGNLNLIYKDRESEEATAINKTIEEDYWVLNMGSSFNIDPEGKYKFQIQVNNLFDTRYSEILGAEMPGRWLMGGFRIQL